MNKLILILLLSLPAVCAAESKELLLGSVTYHVFDIDGASKEYSNKLESSGKLIANALIGYREVHPINEGDYYSITGFGGKNSIDEPILGMAASLGEFYSFGRIGFVAGAYLQDNRKFLERDVQPVSIIPSNGWGLSPVLGMEYIHKVSNGFFVNSLLSPIICNFSIGFEL